MWQGLGVALYSILTFSEYMIRRPDILWKLNLPLSWFLCSVGCNQSVRYLITWVVRPITPLLVRNMERQERGRGALGQWPVKVGFGQPRSEKWRKKCHSLFSRSASEKKLLEIEIVKWKWNENDWKSRSRSESEMKKREVKFLEDFREFKKDRCWSIGKAALPSTDD